MARAGRKGKGTGHGRDHGEIMGRSWAAGLHVDGLWASGASWPAAAMVRAGGRHGALTSDGAAGAAGGGGGGTASGLRSGPTSLSSSLCSTLPDA